MAAYYSEEIIQEVIDANDIVDVIGEYMTLKRAGNSYKGKCPFHNEKTASFTVSREKQLYHCFGCGVGGNVITFLMEMDKLTFLDALKALAERGNVILPEKADENEDRRNHEQRQRLYELHKATANYYFKCLNNNNTIINYLKSRGISIDTIKTFGLGFAVDSWDDLVNFLTQKGFSKEDMVLSGLVMKSESQRYYSRFRNRLMFPILNPRNQIIGFGGRKISDADNGPKYLNSPETPIFAKGFELFNLNRSKNFLDEGKIIIVEGYMDVISLYEKGIKNTVAALGTAFTPYHGKALQRYANEVILTFDGDSAGINATEKAVNILKKTSLNVKVFLLPEGEDPDTYIQKFGLEEFNKGLDNSMTIVEYQLDLLKRTNNLDKTDGRINFSNKAVDILKSLDSRMEIDYYSKIVAKQTGINVKTIQNEVVRLKSGQRFKGSMITEEDISHQMDIKVPKAYERAQKIGLIFCLENPQMAKELPMEFITDSFYREVISDILVEYEKNPNFDTKKMINKYQDRLEVKGLIALLMSEESLSREDFMDALNIMETFFRNTKILEISNKIKEATALGNELEVAELTNKLIELKKR
ncbi:MAG: DNA primase [Eubacteriaceae bacterium]